MTSHTKNREKYIVKQLYCTLKYNGDLGSFLL